MPKYLYALPLHFKLLTALPLPFCLLTALEFSTPAAAEPTACGNRPFSAPFADPGTEHDEFSTREGIIPGDVEHDKQICQNIAISNALADPDLIAGEKAGIKLNLASAGSQNMPAIGLSTALVLAENVFGDNGRVTGTASIAFSGSQYGGRLGVQLSW